MKIIAIDPGTHCGWATWDGHRVESGVQVFDLKRGESPGMRFLRFNHWLAQLHCYNANLDLVIFEQAHHRGGAATEVLVGMTTRIQEFAAKISAEHEGVHSATLKKWATGSGRASKEEMVAAADMRYPDYSAACHPAGLDDNQADALLLLAYAREMYDAEEKNDPKVG